MKILGNAQFAVKECLWVQYLVSFIKTRRIKKYYHKIIHTSLSKANKRCVIFMVDGKIRHGGLCDRLHGLVSTFLFCEERGIDFKVWWKYPFDLELFLVPNEYDWHINQECLSYSIRDSIPYYWGTIHNTKKQVLLAERLLSFKQPQIHAYTNMHYKRDELHINFKRLFKLSPLLESAINRNLQEIKSKNYISLTFRFQQLLGDFAEGNFPVLSSTAAEELMRKSLLAIEQLKRLHPTIDIFLVTSDSRKFLTYVRSKLEYVFIINGELCHMDYVKGEKNQLRHIKSFVDLMMISMAQKAYLCYNPIMYRSSFAHTAALIGGIPYKEYLFS